MKNITVSVDEDFYKKIKILSAHMDISVSELVRRQLSEILQRKSQLNSYELGKDLFGMGNLGSPNLSKNRKKLLNKRIHEKHAKRNSH